MAIGEVVSVDSIGVGHSVWLHCSLMQPWSESVAGIKRAIRESRRSMQELFLWRMNEEQPESVLWDMAMWKDRHICEYCSAPLDVQRECDNPANEPTGERYIIKRKCLLCGWNTYEESWPAPPWGSADNYGAVSILKQFEISSLEVTIEELGSHLRRHFSDIYSLSPVRFEHLVSDIFKNLGFEVRLTKKSWDKGVDIFLSEVGSSEIKAIVECKRFASSRTVGIGIVQRAVGAAIEWKAGKVTVVTSSKFTSSAEESARIINHHGLITIDLVDANELLSLLQVYNKQLPPIHKITENERIEIINKNR